MPEITLYLIRHGESERNIQPDLIGQSAYEKLTQKGEDQAEALRIYFQNQKIKFDETYSSSYKRAYDTACSACCSQACQNIQLVDDLREYSAGDFKDKSRKEVITPEILKEMTDLDMAFKFPNGESLYEVEKRASKWLESILFIPRDKDTSIAVFSHGMTIKCLLHYVMQFNPKLTWKMKLDNTSFSILRLKDDQWFIDCINNTTHLNR